jgi:hypothetical protein
MRLTAFARLSRLARPVGRLGCAKLLWPVIGIVATVELSRAAELSLRLSLRLSEGYNDNIRLEPGPHPSVTITTVSPGMELSARTETVSAGLKAQATVNRYHGDARLDATDLILDGSLKRVFERGQAGASLGYVRDSTLASELRQTGVVQANRQRARVSLNPSWTSQISERASLTLGYDYAQVKYENAEGTGLTGYRTQTPYGIFSYRLSERSRLEATGGVSRLLRDSPRDTLRTVYAQILLEHDLSEVLTAKLGIGANRVRFSSAGSKGGWLAQGSLERRYETGRVSLGVARELNPTGAGELTQTDRLFASWSGKLSPQLSYGLNGAIYRNEPIRSTGGSTADQYYRLSANLGWLMTERWSIEAEIAHARQEPDQGAAARSNSLFFGARYDLPVGSYSF